ncbi:hypothetical protein DFR70_11132 [Nocardia tenerifensis]|uniref:DUF2993 family protein n=1 Tax=Nocardia tenerifensis TaxID=228006 RepID=A0A318JZ53_9NOCA|nr:hypothetical protein [Nocardia tenerifensis]PXX59650.1 hypothetical protein DFR70_11132 [Nocardia tenerifensis]
MRSMKVLTALAAAVTVGATHLVHALTGTAVAAPNASGGEAVPVVAGMTTLALNPDLGMTGLVSMKVGGGKLLVHGHAISGGTVLLKGGIELKAGAKSAKLSNLAIDITTGNVQAKLNGNALALGNVDTSTLRLRKDPGAKQMYVNIGFSDENNIELTQSAATALSQALGIGLEEGDVLLTGGVAAGVDLDKQMASVLNVDLEDAIDAGIDIDVELGQDIDASTSLDLALL